MLDLAKITAEVHQNAVDHGWWEGDRSMDGVFALIHSEWSEALESYRNHEPMVWYQEKDGHQKPEGFAVELIDGCIRIFDLLGYFDAPMQEVRYDERLHDVESRQVEMDEEMLIATCHLYTSQAYRELKEGYKTDAMATLMARVFIIFDWLHEKGIDYEAILLEKHEYNKSRPYKHGGKRI